MTKTKKKSARKRAKKNPAGALPLNKFIRGEIIVRKKNGRRVIQFRRSKCSAPHASSETPRRIS